MDFVVNIYVDTISHLLLLSLSSSSSSLDAVSDDLSVTMSSFYLPELVHEPTRRKNLHNVFVTDDPATIIDMKIDGCGLISG